MTREEAREYFAKHGLSYKDINPSRLRMLFSILNEAFSKEEQTAIKEGVTPYWVRANDDKTFKAKFGDDGLICAYITGKAGTSTRGKLSALTRTASSVFVVKRPQQTRPLCWKRLSSGVIM